MFDYLRGALADKSSHAVTVECGGVGYRVNISLQTHAALPASGEVKLWIHYHVNGQDNVPALFGFATAQEREVFELLTSVQGVGTNTARIILGSLSSGELGAAVTQEREDVFRKVKGVGPKTAKRIILDLKDKIGGVLGEATAAGLGSVGGPAAENPARQAALQALVALGYQKIPAQRALNRVTKQEPELVSDGELVRAALVELRR